jgi:hypothetical protein
VGFGGAGRAAGLEEPGAGECAVRETMASPEQPWIQSSQVERRCATARDEHEGAPATGSASEIIASKVAWRTLFFFEGSEQIFFFTSLVLFYITASNLTSCTHHAVSGAYTPTVLRPPTSITFLKSAMSVWDYFL